MFAEKMSTWTLHWPPTHLKWTNVDIWLTTHPPPFVHVVFEWPLVHLDMIILLNFFYLAMKVTTIFLPYFQCHFCIFLEKIQLQWSTLFFFLFFRGRRKRWWVSCNKSTTSTINGAQTVPPHKLWLLAFFFSSSAFSKWGTTFVPCISSGFKLLFN